MSSETSAAGESGVTGHPQVRGEPGPRKYFRLTREHA
jgi:hypothetical protein